MVLGTTTGSVYPLLWFAQTASNDVIALLECPKVCTLLYPATFEGWAEILKKVIWNRNTTEMHIVQNTDTKIRLSFM